MKIKEWQKTEGVTLGWLANKTGIAMQRLSGIRTGRIEPRLLEAALIYDATDGEVTLDDHLQTIAARKK